MREQLHNLVDPLRVGCNTKIIFPSHPLIKTTMADHNTDHEIAMLAETQNRGNGGSIMSGDLSEVVAKAAGMARHRGCGDVLITTDQHNTLSLEPSKEIRIIEKIGRAHV